MGHGAWRKGGDMAEMEGTWKNGRNHENKGNKYLPLTWLNPPPSISGWVTSIVLYRI